VEENEEHNQEESVSGAIEDVYGKNINLSRAIAKNVTASEDITIHDGLAVTVKAGGQISVTDSISAVLVSGEALSSSNSIANAVVAGGDINLSYGAVQFAVAGKSINVNNSFVGIAFSDQINLGEGSKILMSKSQAILFGVAAGLVIGLISLLTLRKRR
jgi:hypothetical protein